MIGVDWVRQSNFDFTLSLNRVGARLEQPLGHGLNEADLTLPGVFGTSKISRIFFYTKYKIII